MRQLIAAIAGGIIVFVVHSLVSTLLEDDGERDVESRSLGAITEDLLPLLPAKLLSSKRLRHVRPNVRLQDLDQVFPGFAAPDARLLHS
jgi:hypothetical protein